MLVLEPLRLELSIGRPQSFGNLTIYPVIGRQVDLDYLTLDEALREGSVEVREVNGGRVSELLVVNNAPKDLLIVSGEELLGALQNRTVNVSIMIPAESSLRVPVSCTERGRWREGEDGVRMGRISAYYSTASMRMWLLSSVTASLESGDRYDSDQVGIWKIISGLMRKLRVSSRTSAQSDIFRERGEDIDGYLRHFRPSAGQTGLIGLINGRIVSFELFGRADTFSKMFERLVRSLAMEAISERGRPVEWEESIADFVGELKGARVKGRKAPGKGEHLIVEGRSRRGIALSIEGKIVHLLMMAKMPT